MYDDVQHCNKRKRIEKRECINMSALSAVAFNHRCPVYGKCRINRT